MFFCSGVLIAVGSVLLGFVRIKFAKSRVSDKAGERFGRSGSRGAGLLGILFALSFCSVSAALFFGSLFPLAVKNGSSLLRPSAYGAGTGVPVFVFGVPIALGAQWVQGIPEACPVRSGPAPDGSDFSSSSELATV